MVPYTIPTKKHLSKREIVNKYKSPTTKEKVKNQLDPRVRRCESTLNQKGRTAVYEFLRNLDLKT